MVRVVVLLLAGAVQFAFAQAQLRSLKQVRVPEPANLSQYVQNRPVLLALGKALFWDMQAGSDGVTACATCHFHAGADHRPQNQVSDPQNGFAVNLDLAGIPFPLRLLSDPLNRNSPVIRDTSIRIGSMGTFRRVFDGIVPGQAEELGHEAADKPEFARHDLQVRRVTLRNSPSVFNTVFSERNFWDGRAARIFNGFTVTGLDSDSPGVLVAVDGRLERQAVRLQPASLASQAVGPILDPLEMSYEGRTWPLLAKKLLSLRPLARQKVAADDSVLGPLAEAGGKGLAAQFTYRALIAAAFQPAYWESDRLLDRNGDGIPGRSGEPASLSEFTQMEHNFPLFWALALWAYQAALNSDDSPFDRFEEGDGAALTPQEQEGLRLFQTGGRCNECHDGAEFSAAALVGGAGARRHSFERTGVRPVSEDPGSGNGVFKSIGLRNIEFTGPYFHNGGASTLEEVVDFYRRGGDFPPFTNEIRILNLNASQSASLVAFLKTLSDDRVRYERAPFDHPELCVPAGHAESGEGRLEPGGSADFPGSAAVKWRLVPAVGSGGSPAPLQTFEEMLRGIGTQGERAHALTEACAP